MRGVGNGDEGRCDVLCLHPILSHLIQVRGVHILVIVPAETIEGDEQQLVPGGLSSSSVPQWDSSTGKAAYEAEGSQATQQHHKGSQATLSCVSIPASLLSVLLFPVLTPMLLLLHKYHMSSDLTRCSLFINP